MSIAAGFQSGIALGRAFNEGRERRRLEGIRTAAPEMSQGYTAEQGQQLEAIAAARDQEGRPFYNVQTDSSGNYSVTPNFPTGQTPQVGLTGLADGLQDGGNAAEQLNFRAQQRAAQSAPQPIPFNQQRVTDFLGRRFEGELTPDRIEAMRSRAMAEGLSDPRQRQAALAEATRAEREAEEAPLRQEALRTQVAAGKLGLTKAEQDIETGALTLEQQKRTAAELQRGSDFAAFAAERPDATVAELKDAAFKQFKFTPKQWQDTVTTRLGIENAEMDSFKNNIKKKLQGKSLAQIGSIYNSDPDFDDKSDLAIVPGKGGAVTLNFIDKATNTITSSQSFKNEALATEYLNKQATEPETIGTWMMNLQKTQSGIDAQSAAIRASDATVGLRGQQMQMLTDQAAGSAEAQQIRAQYSALTPEEQAGPKGQGLIRDFNMANAKAGMAVPLGTAPRAERPEVTAAAVASYAKDLVGKPSGEMKDGKPVRYTAETAAAAARRALSAQDGVAADPADALIEAMRRNAPTQQQATSAGQGLINLSNTMLPPAAPVRAAPTTSQERLRGLYLGQ
jgi:hypothetical protein